MNKSYIDTFMGFVDLTEVGNQFIRDCRKVVKGTGWKILARGRNPNRKQHPDCKRPSGYSLSIDDLRKSIPLYYSTYAGLYLRESGYNTATVTTENIAGRIEAIRKIYEQHGKTVTTRV